MKYKNYVFDLYGTLIDINTDEEDMKVWKRLAARYKEQGASYTPRQIKKAYEQAVNKRIVAMNNPEGEIDIYDVFLELYEAAGVKATDEMVEKQAVAFRRDSTKFMKLYKGAKELLEKLKENGARVFLLSNAQTLFTMPELENTGIKELFDAIYISSDVGAKKPSPVFYKALLEEKELDPKETIMTGNDAMCDIVAASKLGLATAYIHTDISPEEDAPSEADYVLTTIGELYDLTR